MRAQPSYVSSKQDIAQTFGVHRKDGRRGSRWAEPCRHLRNFGLTTLQLPLCYLDQANPVHEDELLCPLPVELDSSLLPVLPARRH